MCNLFIFRRIPSHTRDIYIALQVGRRTSPRRNRTRRHQSPVSDPSGSVAAAISSESDFDVQLVYLPSNPFSDKRYLHSTVIACRVLARPRGLGFELLEAIK